jgi:23S rRNA (cytidine2498-2'-O)-methyltransferase
LADALFPDTVASPVRRFVFMSLPSASLPAPTAWLVRISSVFESLTPEIVGGLGATATTPLGNEYYLLKVANFSRSKAPRAPFIRWNLPIHHSWPCCPQKTDSFIEKAAQALFRKFAHFELQSLLVGQLDPSSSNRYYKTLASNLRGRVLQLFPSSVGKTDAEAQDPERPTLFCLVGKEGLFCGLQSPRDSNGFFPGGTRYISQSAPGTISRAGAKIAEALHYLRLYRPPLAKASHWLELGASPGGMTSELLKREQRVTAVDRAPLDDRLRGAVGLKFIRADVGTFEPAQGAIFHAILSDMNGDAEESIEQVIRLSAWLSRGGLVVFTLKTSDATQLEAVNDLFGNVVDHAARSGLRLIAGTHLTYNRQEFTLFLEKVAA